MRHRYIYISSIVRGLVGNQCKEPYNPPVKGRTQGFLVVDGIIRNGSDSTIIQISRSKNYGDTSKPAMESGASVFVQGQVSGNFPLVESLPGKYSIPSLSLDPGQPYRIRIHTASGSDYASDWVPVRVSPPIDSVNWSLDQTGVSLFVNAHDPSNQTHYYMWDFIQTWEHDAYIESTVMFQNGQIVARPQADQVSRCWTTTNSQTILVASSVGFSQDVITHVPLVLIGQQAEQFSQVYSILVRQYAITANALAYWENLKQNTERSGSIFDAQPTEVTGNIHNLADSGEPVFGYASISSMTQLRIFIGNYQLNNGYVFEIPFHDCGSWVPSQDSLLYYSTLGLFTPFIQDRSIALTWSICADCRTWGGVTTKPSYWPY